MYLSLQCDCSLDEFNIEKKLQLISQLCEPLNHSNEHRTPKLAYGSIALPVKSYIFILKYKFLSVIMIYIFLHGGKRTKSAVTFLNSKYSQLI